MRIAVLVKQIPAPAHLRMEAGRIVRDGVVLEVNAYCRRANAKAIELVGSEGEVVVFTMGPPVAEAALREMIACGSTRGVHLCDPLFAGSDTLATARTLAAAIEHQGPFDLVLAGLNSLDADTGQVPAELAELLRMPFASGVRDIAIKDRTFTARLETDDGYSEIVGEMPAVLSTAERLCDPSKAPPDQYDLVHSDRITKLKLSDLALATGEVGETGSPTSVGEVRVVSESRSRYRTESVVEAVDALVDLRAFEPPIGNPGTVMDSTLDPQHEIWCFFTESGIGAELLGEATQIAGRVRAAVTAVTPIPVSPGLGALGADRVLAIPNAKEPAEWADSLAQAAAREQPWALLVEGTRSGRVVASIVAARHGWGLTGDAIGIEVNAVGRLVAWKPAFGGQLQVPILSRSPVQLATIRPGVFCRRQPREQSDPEPHILETPRTTRLRTTSKTQAGDDAGGLQRAEIVVAVGQGIDPDGYRAIDQLCAALGGAALGSTRKVTDKGWLPRNTQIGVTGHSIAPRLLVSVAASGRFNHTVGIRNAQVIMAINSDPDAEIFDQVDIGLLGKWEDTLPALTAELASRDLF